MNRKIRSSVIIIQNKKLLVIKSKYSSGKIIFLLPGGGVEDYELLEDAAIRELKEETNLDVKISGFFGYNQYIDKERGKDVLEIIFYGQVIGGVETHLNDPSTSNHILGTYWMSPEELLEADFYPKEIIFRLYSELNNDDSPKNSSRKHGGDTH